MNERGRFRRVHGAYLGTQPFFLLNLQFFLASPFLHFFFDFFAFLQSFLTCFFESFFFLLFLFFFLTFLLFSFSSSS